MADISKININDSSEYNIKDTTARDGLTDRPTSFVGTRSEWNALPVATQVKYSLVNLIGEGVYKNNGTGLDDIANTGGGLKNFQGTIEEWNALTTEQKKAYDHASITGTGGGEYNVDKSTGDLVQTSGMPSEYPASQVMMSDGVTSVEDAMGNMKMSKLWENPNPTSSFVAQDITLSSDAYDLLLIIYIWTTSTPQELSIIVEKSEGFVLSVGLPSAHGSRNFARYCGFTSDTVINFGEARDSVGASSSTVNNDRCIPIVIYGIKLM